MSSASYHMTPTECLTPAFWEHAWHELQRDSILKTTQQIHPGRWRQFYDEVAGSWDQITGHGPEAAKAAVKALDAQHQLGPQTTSLDIGCGTGNLSIAMAARGVKVTAMDDSAGMASVLRRRMHEQKIKNIEIVEAKWEDLQRAASYDLVMAAFFPQVMTPKGIQRMEASARQTCSLVVGAGQETFPFRREIWQKVMHDPLPKTNFNLTCALAYLLTSGRNPNLKHLTWQAGVHLPAEDVTRYFQAYFAIFGKQGPEVREAIDQVIASYCNGGMVDIEREASAALIHWHPHRAIP